MANGEAEKTPVPTGIMGLDDVLTGGFTANRVYLIEGDPGSGKTTLAMQFLLDGVKQGERVLYVTLSETKDELLGVAASHGWSLDNVDICELIPSEQSLLPEAQTRMFHPSEVELSETTKLILAEVERVKPTRIVFDSLSEMRLLSQNALRYRRQVLALKQFFVGRQCTVLLLDDRTSETGDLQLQSIAHGVITLDQLAPEFGAERRRLRIIKLRGRRYRGGFHDFCIVRGGLEVFPRLVASEHHPEFEAGQLQSGIEALDALLGGGLDRGTSVLMVGPAGSGKSSLATQFAAAAAERGERSAIFAFDESTNTLRIRSKGMGMSLGEHLDSGHVRVQQVDPAELSPGEFAHHVRRAVEEQKAKIVIIDSLNGYMNAMPGEQFLTIQLHELLTYLGQLGVVTFLVVAQHGLLGNMMHSPVDASYLADTVLLLRYFEAAGRLRRAISVVKKRSGFHEATLRELRIDSDGIHIDEPLTNFHGVLTGTPQLIDGDPSRGDKA